MMDISARSLKIKRDVISKLLDEGLYPYTKRYLGTFDNHFSTIGLIGMNEVGLNAKWLGEDLTHEKTQEFTKEVLNHMRRASGDDTRKSTEICTTWRQHRQSPRPTVWQNTTKSSIRISSPPDKPGDTPYYTNSSHLPVGYTADIFDALDIQDELQTLYTSGTVFHAFLGEKLAELESRRSTGAQDRRELQPAVLHTVTDLFCL